MPADQLNLPTPLFLWERAGGTGALEAAFRVTISAVAARYQSRPPLLRAILLIFGFKIFRFRPLIGLGIRNIRHRVDFA